MSNKIETVSIGDLPIATELDDADELLLRDASAALPENATARLSIATLRAAMGSPDRIESASGDAFVESTDDFLGMGTSAVLSRVNHSSGSAIAYTAILPGEGGPSHPVLMSSITATNADETQSAGIGAHYDPTTDQFSLGAFGAPLRVEEPTESNHAATKGYVDARLPELEWWEPTWTPVANVNSVSNIECQYTRTYRAAGGSLVTLEGTIEVTPGAADTMTMVSVGLPVPRDGADIIGGIGSFTDYDGDDFGLARAGVADLGAGQQVSVQYTPSTNAVHRVSFRVSYRAA